MSLRPAAQRSRPRTSSQSPLSCSSVRDLARATAFSMRVNAVPGYSASVSSAPPGASPAPMVAFVRTGEKATGDLPTGSHEDGSGPAPEAKGLGDEDDGSTAARAGERETRNDAAVRRSARRPRRDAAARFRRLPMSMEAPGKGSDLSATRARFARRESGRVDAFTRTDARTSAACILRGWRRARTSERDEAISRDDVAGKI